MALREDQIVRYGRQILLRELGGRGQERLLASPVRVLGGGPGVEDAVAWLLAGGTPIALAPGVALGGFLSGAQLEALNPDGLAAQEPVAELVPWGFTSPAPAQVVLGAGVAFRTAAACEECWVGALRQLGGEPAGGPIGSLAALTLQRVILGWSDPVGIVRWSGERLENRPLATCSHGQNTK